MEEGVRDLSVSGQYGGVQVKSILVWVGNYGTYKMPKKFDNYPYTKSGLPDMRYKKSAEVIRWFRDREYKSLVGRKL